MSINFNDTEGATPYDKIPKKGSVKINRTISSKSLHGLCFWIDGQVNCRSGVDKTKTYMEDLVLPQNSYSNSGYSEYLHSGEGNIWDGDFLELHTWACYPNVSNEMMSVEAVVKVNKVPPASMHVLTTTWTGGWQVSIKSDCKVHFVAREKEANDYIRINIDQPLEINKAYYIVATLTSQKEITLLVKGIDQKASAAIKTFKKNSVTMGMGTEANTTLYMNKEKWEGLSVGMARVWYRVLSDEEIENNYKDVKQRFNTV